MTPANCRYPEGTIWHWLHSYGQIVCFSFLRAHGQDSTDQTCVDLFKRCDDRGGRTIGTGCGQYRDLDMAALWAKMGGEFSLWSRRKRCRLTDRCSGWNRFYYLKGRA